ncbi:GCN5-related N-acetyltransferase [Verrucomicrobia bacterium]|nr:GCN5-related N-acetyltransferase [Verrucomicrobiota bacterium]
MSAAVQKGTLPSPGCEIREAQCAADVETVRALFTEYAGALEVNLCFQNFRQELAGLPGCYAPPKGRLLLAWVDREPAGCIGLRSLGEGVCEMKRLYLRPAFRGRGIGRRLAESVIADASHIGYDRMRLDTLASMKEALALYESLGFRRIGPYYHNPSASAVFMELPLDHASRKRAVGGDRTA